MSRRISVRATMPCFVQGKDRKVGELFLVDEHLVEPLPSCLQRVTAERVEEPELVEVPQP